MNKGASIAAIAFCLLLGAGASVEPPAADPPAPQGELRLTGTGIKRLTLERPGQPDIVLQSPAPATLLPAGRYRWKQVDLDGGKGVGIYTARTHGYGPWITIAPGKPATLDIGGPLTPEVQVSRNGSKLVLIHLLRDATGRHYYAEGRSDRPRFIATQNGKTIGSGRFEYG